MPHGKRESGKVVKRGAVKDKKDRGRKKNEKKKVVRRGAVRDKKRK